MTDPHGVTAHRRTWRRLLVLAAVVVTVVVPSSTASAAKPKVLGTTTVDLSGLVKVSTQKETPPQSRQQTGPDLRFGFIQIVGGTSVSADTVTSQVVDQLKGPVADAVSEGLESENALLGGQLGTMTDLAKPEGVFSLTRAALSALPGVCGSVCKAGMTLESAPFGAPRDTAKGARRGVVRYGLDASGTVTMTIATTDRRGWFGMVGANVQICRTRDNHCFGFPICKVQNKPCHVQLLTLGEKGFAQCTATPVCTVKMAWHNEPSTGPWPFRAGDQLVLRLQVWAAASGYGGGPSVTVTEVSISDLKVRLDTLRS